MKHQIWVERAGYICWGVDAVRYHPREIIFKHTPSHISVMWVISMRASSVCAYPSFNKYYLAMSAIAMAAVTAGQHGACVICSRPGALTLNGSSICRQCALDIEHIRESAIDITPMMILTGDGGAIDVVAIDSDATPHATPDATPHVYFFHRISVHVSNFRYSGIIHCSLLSKCKMCSSLEEICARYGHCHELFIDVNWEKIALVLYIGIPEDTKLHVSMLFVECMCS